MKLASNNRVAPLVVALLGWQTTSTSAQREDRPVCANQTDCLSCLSEDCAWTIGECMSWCMVADVECYRLPDDKNSTSPQEVCDRYVNDEADSALCGSKSDCSSCVGTVKSDGNSTCQWIADGNSGFCTPGCTMIGCGVDTCDDDGNRVVAPEEVASCDQEDCLSCLEASCVWTENMCSAECLADGSCFYPAEWNGMSATQACADATSAQEDKELCNSQTDCTDCVGATKSDGFPCMWFEEYGSCQTACNMWGDCGVTTCEGLNKNSTTPSDCDSNDDCLSCLTSDCVWTDSQCMESCDIMDIACYQVSGDRTAEDVCDVAEKAEEDFELCDSKADCTSCVNATKSDGSSCLWSDEGEGFCASECLMQPCGSATCDASACDHGDCLSCLESSCVWTNSTCMPFCAIMADSSCYEVSDNETASDVCDAVVASDNVEARGVGSSGPKGFLSATLKLAVLGVVVFFSW